LDGLRGIAALSVCVHHFASAYVPRFIPGEDANTFRISDTPLGVFYSGSFAVSIFFVLSGLVVSGSAAKRHMPVAFNLAQRYFRLAIPVLAGTLYGWALLKLFAAEPRRLILAHDHPWLHNVYENSPPSFGHALISGSIGVFVNGLSGYNNAMWTMRIELLGSFAIYLVYGLISSRRRRLLVLILCAVLTLAIGKTEYTAFALGSLLREAHSAGRLPNSGTGWALLMGVCFGAIMKGWSTRLGLPGWTVFSALGQPLGLIQVLAAVAVIYSALGSAMVQKFLNCRPAQFLGEISFPLYLVHVPLLYTVFAVLYLAIPAGPLWIACLLIVFLAASMLIGYVFTILIDKPVMFCIHRAQRFAASRKPPHPGGMPAD
jgi:peptidoglycan/LPS O-acetylase OafA/YrhL